MKRCSMAIALLFGLAWVVSGCAAAAAPVTAPSFPAFVSTTPDSLKAYQLAVQLGDLLYSIPCYCGCVEQNHQSLHDCFFKPNGTYEEHASTCAVCQKEVFALAQMAAQGKNVKTMRTQIDATFASYGAPTHTAPVE